MDLTARLRLIDNMTAPLRRATQNMKRTGEVVSKAANATSTYERVTSRAGRSVSQLANSNNRMTQTFGSLPGIVGKATAALGALAIGTTAVGLAYSSLNKAMDFEAQMSSIQALTGASNEEMKKMNDLAMKMGASTKYSALEAAQGIEELLKAGLTPAAVQAGGLQNALNLATAGGLELADAAEIMSTALNAYKRDALTATDASNILAGTANASATGVMDLRYSLAAVSAVAAGVGMTFRDTNTALGLFANNGLKGSDAGTSLKTMLSNLQPTTDTQIDLFKRLGIVTKSGANAFYDARGKLKGLDQIASILQKSLGNMTDQQRMLALETMFGSDAIRAATILFHEGADGVRDFQREMSKVTALDVAKQKMDNAKGAIEQLGGALETIQISALQPMLPVIKDMALLFANMAEQYGPQIAATFEDIGKSMREFLDPYLNDPKTWQVTGQAEMKFKQGEMLDRTSGPPPFWDNLMGRFNEWYATSGKAMLMNATSQVTRTVAETIEANAGVIAEVGISIGLQLASAISQGIQNGLENSVFGKALLSSMPALTYSNKAGNWIIDTINGTTDGNHYHGLEYVPRDQYQATLHKGERVLTAQENHEYSEPGSGRSVTIAKLADQIVVREEADIDRIAYRLAKVINETR